MLYFRDGSELVEAVLHDGGDLLFKAKITQRFLAAGFKNEVRLPRSVKRGFLNLEGLMMITSVLRLFSSRPSSHLSL